MANDSFHSEGASSLHLELLRAIHMEVGGLEPDFVSNLPRGEFGGYPLFHFLLGYLVGGLSIVTGSRSV